MNQKNHLTVSEETQVDLPISRKVMGVDRALWNRLKTIVNRIGQASSYWQNAAWFAMAASLSFFLSALTTSPGFSLQPPNFFSMMTLISVVAAAILFIADKAVGVTRETAKQDVLELMQEIELASTAKTDIPVLSEKNKGKKKIQPPPETKPTE